MGAQLRYDDAYPPRSWPTKKKILFLSQPQIMTQITACIFIIYYNYSSFVGPFSEDVIFTCLYACLTLGFRLAYHPSTDT